MAEPTYTVKTGRYANGEFWYSVTVYVDEYTTFYAPVILEDLADAGSCAAAFVRTKHGPNCTRTETKN